MDKAAAAWNLLSEHSGTYLRLQRMLEGRQSFKLCFLTYSDSFYRDRVAEFLHERLCARVRVHIDPETRIGTEDLFERLGSDPDAGAAQLLGAERWPEGFDNLLTRLNYRRGALAERCARPLLVWVRSRDLRAVATGAADLWAWRSGVFDFTLSADTASLDLRHSRVDRTSAIAPRRMARVEELERYLAHRCLRRPTDVDLLIELGDLLNSLGRIDRAESAYREAREALTSMDDRRRSAIADGRIADVLQARGELDEALRIRTEEQLPVFEQLGDVRSRAITQGNIADILVTRGELDEALRIRTEEELPVYEQLGDVHSRAIIQGRIADILVARGELDEALRICAEEQLPVFEQLGDVRSRAITQGRIADILVARGELDEALRICAEEQLPVFEQLGDVRSRAITQGNIADILVARGELDEALRIRAEEQLPVFEQLGDVRSRAITQGRIADILVARGELDEALRTWTGDVLPVLEELGDQRSIEVAQGRIAAIRTALGRD